MATKIPVVSALLDLEFLMQFALLKERVAVRS